MIYYVIAKCIAIKYFWAVKLRSMDFCSRLPYIDFNNRRFPFGELHGKKVNTFTGTSVRDMFNPQLDFIFRADGEHQQIRGTIYDVKWCDFPDSQPYAKRSRRFLDFVEDILDHRKPTQPVPLVRETPA